MISVNNRLIQRKPSRAIQVARRAGIEIDLPNPHVTVVEQEETDLD
jgi:hypothetical protein